MSDHRWRSRWGVFGAVFGAAVATGCYRHVTRAEGPMAEEYEVHERADESGFVFFPQDKKDEPERVRPKSKGIR